MQQAMTAQTVAIKDIVSQTTRAALSPLEQEVLSMRFGSLSNMRNKVLRGHLQSMMQEWSASPASAYHSLYKSSLVPLSARMSMLDKAPLAALGLGPLSWRNAEVTRAPLQLSPGAVKSIGGMAVSQLVAPGLEYVANHVAPDPTTWTHALAKVGGRAISGAGAGALVGFGAGTASTGVGGAPAAGIGAVVGGLIGLAHGIFDAMSDVKQYELKTAEDLKRYND